MGFFSALGSAVRDANEEAHGSRLLKEVQGTFAAIGEWDERVQFSVMAGFSELRSRLIDISVNLSREGRIKVGRELQSQASKSFNFDLAGSGAKWMAGAWLESRERDSMRAQEAFLLLDGFAEYVREGMVTAKNRTDVLASSFPYATFNEWLVDFKHAAACANDGLALNAEQASLVDFMDHKPLKRAFDDGVDPWKLGHDFGVHFDLETFGADR